MSSYLLPSFDQIHTIVFDFDGVFTDNKLWLDQYGNEYVQCNRGDGLAFDMLRAFIKLTKWPLEYFILSKEKNPVVLARADKLKIECHHGVDDKRLFVEQYLLSRFPNIVDRFAGLVYLGNDLNDLSVMRLAGMVVAPADAHPRIKDAAHIVLDQRGGEGFVRAFIEHLLDIEGMSDEQLDKLI